MEILGEPVISVYQDSGLTDIIVEKLKSGFRFKFNKEQWDLSRIDCGVGKEISDEQLANVEWPCFIDARIWGDIIDELEIKQVGE